MRVTLIALFVLVIRSRKEAQISVSMHVLRYAFRSREKKIITICDWLVIHVTQAIAYNCDWLVIHVTQAIVIHVINCKFTLVTCINSTASTVKKILP